MELDVQQVCQDLMSLVAHFKLYLARASERHDLTLPQLYALYAILHGDSTTGELAVSLHCDASNVTGIIDRLITHKLVIREEDEQDRRTKRIRLTAKGNELIQEISDAMPEGLHCGRLTSEECVLMHDLVMKLIVD